MKLKQLKICCSLRLSGFKMFSLFPGLRSHAATVIYIDPEDRITGCFIYNNEFGIKVGVAGFTLCFKRSLDFETQHQI